MSGGQEKSLGLMVKRYISACDWTPTQNKNLSCSAPHRPTWSFIFHTLLYTLKNTCCLEHMAEKILIIHVHRHCSILYLIPCGLQHDVSLLNILPISFPLKLDTFPIYRMQYQLESDQVTGV